MSLEKPNLAELLHKIEEFDNDLIAFTPEEHVEHAKLISSKVDDIYRVRCSYEYRISYYKKLVDDYKAVIASLEKSNDRLTDWCEYAMRANKFDRVTGDLAAITLIKNKKVVMTHSDKMIDSTTFARYSEAIERTFRWNKMVIKNNPAAYVDVAKLESTVTVRFNVNKRKAHEQRTSDDDAPAAEIFA